MIRIFLALTALSGLVSLGLALAVRVELAQSGMSDLFKAIAAFPGEERHLFLAATTLRDLTFALFALHASALICLIAGRDRSKYWTFHGLVLGILALIATALVVYAIAQSAPIAQSSTSNWVLFPPLRENIDDLQELLGLPASLALVLTDGMPKIVTALALAIAALAMVSVTTGLRAVPVVFSGLIMSVIIVTLVNAPYLDQTLYGLPVLLLPAMAVLAIAMIDGPVQGGPLMATGLLITIAALPVYLFFEGAIGSFRVSDTVYKDSAEAIFTTTLVFFLLPTALMLRWNMTLPDAQLWGVSALLTGALVYWHLPLIQLGADGMVRGYADYSETYMTGNTQVLIASVVFATVWLASLLWLWRNRAAT